MAVRTAQTKYARKAMYDGSAAYDLERLGWYDPRPDGEQSPKAAPAPRPRAAAKPQTMYGFSLFAAAGVALAAVLMVFVLLAYVNYTELSNESVRLEDRLADLTEQERTLTIKYEETFDITQVEAYATGTLGMSKPSESQTVDLSLRTDDKAVVLMDSGDATAEAGLSIGGLVQFFTSLVAYFK